MYIIHKLLSVNTQLAAYVTLGTCNVYSSTALTLELNITTHLALLYSAIFDSWTNGM